nr:MAG TPA: hypothetical protein [Caudoviricetes sp.]
MLISVIAVLQLQFTSPQSTLLGCQAFQPRSRMFDVV